MASKLRPSLSLRQDNCRGSMDASQCTGFAGCCLWRGTFLATLGINRAPGFFFCRNKVLNLRQNNQNIWAKLLKVRSLQK